MFKKIRFSLLYQTAIIVLGIAFATLFYTCSHEVPKESDFYGTVNNIPDSFAVSENEARIYTMPTPLQISSAIKIYGFKYDEKLLLPVSNNMQYPSNFSKALNLGLRTIDMGYAAVYSYNGRAFDYLRNVKQLMEELGITSHQKAALMERFEKNLQNQDSLYKTVLEAYRHGHDYFQNNGREGLGLLILTGCFVEGLHLTMGIKKNQQDEKYLNLIAQHKIYLQNLIELLAFYNNAPDVEALVDDLKKLNSEFEKINLNYNDPQTKPFSVKGNISDEVYQNIQAKVNVLRNEIAG